MGGSETGAPLKAGTRDTGLRHKCGFQWPIPQVLRLSVQAAAFTKDKAFGNYAISLMEIHNPGAVSLAQDFLNNALN